MKSKRIHNLGSLLGVVLFCSALWVLHHELKPFGFHDILRTFQGIPSKQILYAMMITALSYLVMSGYDILALKYIGQPLSLAKIALTSFVSYAFSNNMGLGMIAGSSVRYRLYSTWGLSILQITRIIAFCTLTLWLGFFTLGGATFLIAPFDLPANVHLPVSSTRVVGIIFLGLVLLYSLWSILRKHPLKIKGWEFALPPANIYVAQIALATADWALAGTVLYVLLPEPAKLPFAGFLSIYLLAQTLGLVSQIPGGLGVFETAMLILLSPYLAHDKIIASLLAYRAVYYLLPLGLAALLLGSQEFLRTKTRWLAVARSFSQWGTEIIPSVLALTTFAGGALLLFSGATPAISTRLLWLEKIIPLPLQEISHFAGSLAGTGLLLLARGLQRRLDAAYLLTVLLLGVGIIASVFKGLDYEEAVILALLLMALAPARHHFYRKASFFSQRFNPGWIAAIAIVILCALWLGLFSYKHVEYSSDLWWRFTLHGNAPRFLRAQVGIFGALLFFSLSTLLRPARPKLDVSSNEQLHQIFPIVKSSDNTAANLALLGDKVFLLNQKKTAFIMYRVEGRSWIALGDPIGPQDEWIELIWQFREICDRNEGWPVFYELGHQYLYLYLDLGLKLLKLGEVARVPLETFSLEGAARKELRYTKRKFEKDGFSFNVIPAEEIPAYLPKLKQISDAWLSLKNTREKSFSLGFFNENYLRYFPAGVVIKDEQILAFSNIWQGAGRLECSIDLMRHLPGAPNGLMEYLFVELMRWGKEQGYRWFNLGMAPLSGLENHELAPLWNRLGAFIFRHGEHFYNFKGLRQYKNKFDPVWEPRYLAVPSAVALPRIFGNLGALISSGIRGIVSK